MAEGPLFRRWVFRLLFVALCFLVAFGRLLPLDIGPGGFPGPDLILLLAFAWLLRQPSYVPVLLVAAVLLMADVLFLRPLGLWAGIGVLGCEFLRRRERVLRENPFPLEWASVGAVVVSMTVAYVLILSFVAAPRPALGQMLLQMIMTILAYPLVVLVSSQVFGVRRASPGDIEGLGYRS